MNGMSRKLEVVIRGTSDQAPFGASKPKLRWWRRMLGRWGG